MWKMIFQSNQLNAVDGACHDQVIGGKREAREGLERDKEIREG